MKRFAGLIAGSILANGAPAFANDDIIVAKRIRAGAIISATDIVVAENHEAFRRAASIIGKEAARALYPGQPIDTSTVKSPTLVKRNAVVEMKYTKGAMQILAEGRALDEGSIGDRIRVMNLLSKKIVVCVIDGENSVKANR